MTEQDENIALSKTQIKKQMNDRQDLGFELTRLSEETLKKIDLPEDLLNAIQDYKKITSNSALKRQVQYIGRLMRDVDVEPIETFLLRLSGKDNAYKAFLQRVERWRDMLIENDQALSKFIEEFPQADIGQLRTFIRNTRKEQEQNKPPKAFRSLYQSIKEAMETSVDE